MCSMQMLGMVCYGIYGVLSMVITYVRNFDRVQLGIMKYEICLKIMMKMNELTLR